MVHLPFVASFLLERFAVEEEVAGDLVEEYRSGRSRPWVWYQVLAAVLLKTVRTVRDRRWQSAYGVVLGWLVAASWEYMTARTLEFTSGFIVLPSVVLYLMLSGGLGFSQALAGALIGRVCRPYGPPIVLAYLASFALAATISSAYAPDDGSPGGVWFALWMAWGLSVACVGAIIGVTLATGTPHRAR
jgi:hypothetical protein